MRLGFGIASAPVPSSLSSAAVGSVPLVAILLHPYHTSIRLCVDWLTQNKQKYLPICLSTLYYNTITTLLQHIEDITSYLQRSYNHSTTYLQYLSNTVIPQFQFDHPLYYRCQCCGWVCRCSAQGWQAVFKYGLTSLGWALVVSNFDHGIDTCIYLEPIYNLLYTKFF